MSGGAGALNGFPTTRSGASSGAVTALEARVAALEARMTAAEADIAALQTATPAPQEYACPMAAEVRQLVYKTAVANAVDLADASAPTKMRANGVITNKPTATSCQIISSGELGGFTGRTPSAKQYADPASPGGITETRPDPLVHDVQEIGYAKSDTVIVFTIGGNPPIPASP